MVYERFGGYRKFFQENAKNQPSAPMRPYGTYGKKRGGNEKRKKCSLPRLKIALNAMKPSLEGNTPEDANQSFFAVLRVTTYNQTCNHLNNAATKQTP